MYRRFRNDNRVFEAGTKKTKKGEAGVLKHNHEGNEIAAGVEALSRDLRYLLSQEMSRVLVVIPYLQLTNFQPYHQKKKRLNTRIKMGILLRCAP